MMLVLRVLTNAVGLWLAARFVEGVNLSSELTSILFVALIFGLVNAVVRPITMVLALPALLLTLGLFTFVVNAAMLGLTAWLTDSLAIDGFQPALLGALVISAISWLGSRLLSDDDKRRSENARRGDGDF